MSLKATFLKKKVIHAKIHQPPMKSYRSEVDVFTFIGDWTSTDPLW